MATSIGGVTHTGTCGKEDERDRQNERMNGVGVRGCVCWVFEVVPAADVAAAVANKVHCRSTAARCIPACSADVSD